MSSTTFHPVSSDQATNREILTEGVKGVTCVDAGSVQSVAGSLAPHQVIALAKMQSVIDKMVGIHPGTVEVYANGALNVYLRMGSQVVGYVTYRL